MAAAEAATVGELFAAAIVEYEHEPALQTRTAPCRGRGASTAAGLLPRRPGWPASASSAGVIACWLTNRPEFHAADIGAALLGAASFSIYPPTPSNRPPTSCRTRGAEC